MAYTSSIEVSNVKNAGDELNTNTDKMYKSLSDIANLISGSSACFDSPAGAQLRNQFKSSAQQFETFRTFLYQYGEFLKTHASNVTAFENAVSEGLSQIPKL